MKWRRGYQTGLIAIIYSGTLAWLGASPTAHYVWPSSPNPLPPYLTWETAAHTIQEAVDAAASGSTVVVTNGVYATGSRAASEAGTVTLNRVVIQRPLTLRSVNGPEVTLIAGN